LGVEKGALQFGHPNCFSNKQEIRGTPKEYKFYISFKLYLNLANGYPFKKKINK